MSCGLEIPKCKIHPALHEETDKGWVWLCLRPDSQDTDPKPKGFGSRMTVKISNGKKSVYCEYREIEAYFKEVYDCKICKSEDKKLDKLEIKNTSAVMSDWYRKALDVKKDTEIKPEERPTLVVAKPSFDLWADVLAGYLHPEPGVRMATRIAIWGLGFGLFGVIAVFLSMCLQSCPRLQMCLLVVSLVAIVVLYKCAFWGVQDALTRARGGN